MPSPVREGEEWHQVDEGALLLPSEVKSDSTNDIGSNSDLQSKGHIESVVQTQGNGSVMPNEVTSSDLGEVENLHGAAEQPAINSEKPADREKISLKSDTDVAAETQTLENSSKSEITNYNTMKATQPPKAEQSPEEAMSQPIPRKKQNWVVESQQKSAVAGSPPLESEEKKTDSDDGAKRAVDKNKGSRGSNVSHIETASNLTAKQVKSAKRATKKSVAEGSKRAKKQRSKGDDNGKKATSAKRQRSSSKPKTERNIKSEKTSTEHDASVIAPEDVPGDVAAIKLILPRLLDDPALISNYLHILIRNVEFFFPSKSNDIRYVNFSPSGSSGDILGVRCIHCRGFSDRNTPKGNETAAYFPKKIKLIADDIESIGAQHLFKGRCKHADPQLALEMKSKSMEVSGMDGKISFKKYCDDVADHYRLSNNEVEGVLWDGKEGTPSTIGSKVDESPEQQLIIQPPSPPPDCTQASPSETAHRIGASSTTIQQPPRDRKAAYCANVSNHKAAADAVAPQTAHETAAAGNPTRCSTRDRRAPERMDAFISLDDNDNESFFDSRRAKRKSKEPDVDSDTGRKKRGGGKRAKKREDPESDNCSSAAASLSMVPPNASKQRSHPESSKSIGIDSRVLRLLPQEGEYCEETAYRFHNPPFLEDKQQLAIVRDQNIPGNMKPITSSELEPLPLPSPFHPGRDSDHCDWSFDQTTRVLLANFLAPAAKHDGKVIVTREDKEFLLNMMQRDDITVISEGLAGSVAESSVLKQNYIKTCIGTQYHHKVKEFRKTSVKPRGCVVTGETDGLYDETKWHSMTFHDYFTYLEIRQQQAQNDENTNAVSAEKMFSFVDCDGQNVTIDPRESVLYMLDLDMIKMLPRAYDEFVREFKIPEIIPGGKHCLMNAVNSNGRPFMGPNIYMTPPSSFTQFHQDGHGTVDSGHLCCRGYNEVVMLRRLPERHKHHALHLLNSESSSSGSFLYGKPHDLEYAPLWPTNKAIEECEKMGYCPSVFILKPGQLVHINKGRLHAFRKLSSSSLQEEDCHYSLRKGILPSLHGKDLTCVSIAWDWMFKGVTDEGINREVASILECARLNQKQQVQSLAIPETALLFLARDLLGVLKAKDEHGSDDLESEAIKILRGILPSLQYVVYRHKMTEETSKKWEEEGKHKKVSIDAKPNTAHNPDSFSLDPHGSGDFICKFCSDELSNLYLHCEGCERLLNKDFNICASCHADELYKRQIRMHPFQKKMKSTLNHTGNMRFQRYSHCPCHNGPQCDTCAFCIGCSCICHQHFTLHYRFMPVQEEMQLLKDVVDAVGDTALPTTLETTVRLFSLLSSNSHVPIEAFTNDTTTDEAKQLHSTLNDSAENIPIEETIINDDDMVESVIDARKNESSEDTDNVKSPASDNESADCDVDMKDETVEEVCPVSEAHLNALTKGCRVMIRLQNDSDDWKAEVLKCGSGKKEGQFQIRYQGQKKSVPGKWVKRTDITGILGSK